MNTNYKEKYLKYKKKYSNLKKKHIIPQTAGSSSLNPTLPNFTDNEKRFTGATIIDLSKNNVSFKTIESRNPSVSPSKDYDIRPQGILTFQDNYFINNLRNVQVNTKGKTSTPGFNVKFVNSGIPLLDKHILMGFNIDQVEVNGVNQNVLKFKNMSIDFENNIYKWTDVHPMDDEVHNLAQFFKRIDGNVHLDVNYTLSNGHMIIYRSEYYSIPSSESYASRTALESTNQKMETFNESLQSLLQNNQNNQSMEEQITNLRQRVDNLEKLNK